MKFDKRLIIKTLPFVIAGGIGTKIGKAYRITDGDDLSQKLLGIGESLGIVFENPVPSLNPQDLLVGVVIGLSLRLIVHVKAKNAKKFRHGVEYGSARWGGFKDIQPYVNKRFADNVILSETESLTMSGRPPNPKFARNKNILVIGGSGSGKTRFFVKPNLLQMHSSYVVTDPKVLIL
jgi:type IV secretion system protein VirD4